MPITTTTATLQFLFATLFFSPVFCWAQEKGLATDRFSISGLVFREVTFTTDSLMTFSKKPVGDVNITNHLGEKKSEAKNLTGILIKDILSRVQFKAETPKVLSEFYITLVASDGYKIVFSWNEIFNSQTGDNAFVVTSKDGKSISEMKESILVISSTDFKTGRRFLKGLQSIIVGRVQ